MDTDELNTGGNPAIDWHPIQGEVEILLVASCYRNRDKLRPGGPVDLSMQIVTSCNPGTALTSTWTLLFFTVSTDTNLVNTSFLPFLLFVIHHLKALFNHGVYSSRNQLTYRDKAPKKSDQI